MTEQALRIAVRDAGLRLQKEGLIARTWGNVSVRLDEKRMLITPSGIPYTDIEPDMIVAVGLENDEWQGKFKPSGERKLHAAIYRLRKDVQAVIHTHQNAASVIASSGRALSLDEDEISQTLMGGATIQCAPYALPSTKKLTVGTSSALGTRNAAFMANHGVVCAGSDIDHAFDVARELEHACSRFLTNRSPGLPSSPDEQWNDSWLSTVPKQSPHTLSSTGTELEYSNVSLLSTAPYTLAYASMGKSMPAVLDDIAQIIGPKLKFVDSGADLSRIVSTLKGNGSVLLKGMGALCVYPTRSDAEAAAMVIEKTARALIAGESIGGAHSIPAWEAVLMRFVYRNSYSKQAKKTGSRR